MPDWTQPPLTHAPGDLGPALRGARLSSLENDRDARTIRLRFALPPEAGTPEASSFVTGATHLLTFVYLPPTAPLPQEDVLAPLGDWARQGLVQTADPFAFGTPLVVARAFLHVGEDATTFAVEGYGEDPDLLVWWEVRAAGTRFEGEEAA